MKLIVLFLFVFNFQVRAHGYGQTVFTLNMKNVDVETVLGQLQQESNYRFFYNAGQIRTLEPVTVVVKNETLPNILSTVLGQRFGFRILEDDLVVISPKKEVFRNVQGTVLDEKGAPLAGVSVVVKGTAKGTTTNSEGKYVVDAGDRDVLIFSMVGYENQEIAVNKRTVIDVQLSLSASSLDKVVVVGYGTTRKRDLTGSVGSVKIEELHKAPVRSFEEALAGRLAGVTAMASDGQPGADINIVVRGNNSLTQDNSPLYVIDGFPMENPDNNALNPAEIESIEVLKDASSTAIYGARGANGVILVTTKKGRIGKPVITYNGYSGFQQNNRKMEMMSPYEYIKYQYERDSANVTDTYFLNGKTLEDFRNIRGIDLQDSLFSTSPFTNHFLSVSGGNADTKYSISGSALNQTGILTNSGYDRYQGRIRLDQRVNKNLLVGANTNYSYLHQYGTSPAQGGNGFYYGNLLYSVWAFRPVSGKIIDPTSDLELEDDDFLVLNGFNPIKTARNELRERFSNVLITDAYAEHSFAKYFKLRVTGGLTTTQSKSDVFNNSQTPRGSPLTKTGKDNGVSGSEIFTNRTSWVNENTLNFSKKVRKSDQFTALAGFTLSGTKASSYGAAANHIPNEELGISGMDEGQPVSVTSTSSTYTLASFLGRVNYSLLSRYLFTASLRADGSSKFSTQNKWSYFPSGAFAWRLSDEGFMKGLAFISNAKLRVSYGSTGNNRVSDFAYLSRINLPSSLGYSFNNDPRNAAILTALGNPNLKWETTNQADIGLELGFFNQRIAIEADVYRKVTSDLLLNAAVPGSIGFSTALKNIGKVQNQGLEITLNTVNLNRKLTWNTNFNISFNRNKVLALSDNETQRLTTASWDTYTQNVPLYIAEIGQPIARFWGYIWEGNYQYSDFDETSPGVYTLKADVPSYGIRANIRPGDIKFRDIDGDGVVNADDRAIIGNPNPDFTGGFSNSFAYGNFDLNIFFNFSVGNQVININRIKFEGAGQLNQNMYATYVDRWSPENQNNTYFRTGGQGPVDFAYSSRVIEDGSYLKLRTASLGYNLPENLLRRIKVSNLRLYASAQNLLTFTKYKGFDPEVNKFGSDALRPAFDYSVYPHARTITFGLNLSF